ncbi:NAD-dependent epimerase/dehydratase family protein [Pelagibius marinus]|uniref:NAD-dependent epimerase/dehydratase family protein n=1 Tax=Pelagibius marinus TaxID=2762760 RepID=UPI00187270B8|nr:NAD-dependent epimerase/dehydratase family protein [Pelagibius marinus]
MPVEQITVFGGTGFLGRRIVDRLRRRGLRVRVAGRKAGTTEPSGSATQELSVVRADVRDAASVDAAVAGAQGVVNAVGLYVERGEATFHAVHVEGAGNVAAACRRHGVERLVQLSGIGADQTARSAYIRCRGEGEAAVRAAFEQATVFRPSVMFAADDAFLNTLLPLVRRLPVIPLFGRGDTRLQPVFAEDVAEAAVRVLTLKEPPAPLYGLGGPQIYSYRQLLKRLMDFAGRRPLLLPLPFPLWDTLALAAGVLPRPPLTEGQVALMKQDNFVPPDLPGLDALGIKPTSIDEILRRDFAPAKTS